MRDKTKLSERQRSILKFMESYVNTFGFPPTIREIGEATNIKSTSVVNYNLNKLVQGGYLARINRKSRGIRLTAQGIGTSSVRPISKGAQVPLFGTIVAGKPLHVPDDLAHADDSLEVPAFVLGGAAEGEVFALRVKGDSMIDAMIQDGDYVILQKQMTASDGEMVAVWLEERGETTLKYFYNEGEKIRLQPAHPTMEPIYVSAAQCQVRGRVLSVIRTLNKQRAH